MQKQLLPEAEGYARTNVRRRIWRRFVRVMACIVVFCTTYALILPAITLERTGVCELEEHTHSDECYSLLTAQEVARLSCTLDSLQIHTHTRDCYDANNELLCGFADFVVHEHSGACFDAAGNLVCTLPVVREHEHTDACYEPVHIHTEDCYIPEGELICELEEIEAHNHDETCAEAVLVCEATVEPHEHTDGCYEQLVCQLPEDENHTHDDSCTGLVLVCSLTEQPHTHGESCYETEYVCGLEETEGHTHEESCYASEETLICEEEEAAEGEDPRGELLCQEEEIVLHSHEDECYEIIKDAEGNEIEVLICEELEIREHIHGESCFVTETVELNTEALTCALAEGHVHAEACYDENGALICTQPENHTHTDMCYGTWVLTCEKEEHTHTEECAPEGSEEVTEAENFDGPQIGDKVWINRGTHVYKTQTDENGWSLRGNYEVEIVDIITDDTGAVVMYEFEFTSKGLNEALLHGYKYVKASDITVEDADEVEPDEHACNCGENAPENLANHADSCPRKQYVKTLFEGKSAEEIYAAWYSYDEALRTDLLNLLQVWDSTKYEKLTELIATTPDSEKETTVGDVGMKLQGVPDAAELSAETLIPQDFHEDLFEVIGSKKIVFAMDITLTMEETVWQPADDHSVTVTVDALALGLTEGERIGILHDHNGTLADLGVHTVTDGMLTFTTNGFSSFYGYTVDFEYDGTWHSIQGMGGIHLSVLMRSLEIERDISEVSDVEFSDYSLISITKQVNDPLEGNMVDWYLESLQPFTSEELLTIYFWDGSKLEINVYDAIGSDGTITGTNNPVSGTKGAMRASGDAAIQLTGNLTLTGTISVPAGSTLTITSNGDFSITRAHKGVMFDVDGTLIIGSPNGGNRITINGSTSYQSNVLIYYVQPGANSGVQLYDVLIQNNWGRAIYVEGNAVNLKLDRCTISNCADTAGSAMYLAGSGYGTIDVRRTVIEGCTSSEVAADSYADWLGYNSASAMAKAKASVGENCAGTVRTNGGGRWTLNFTDCVFRNNETWGHGGGIYWNAKGKDSVATAKLTITDCQFINNWALNFGGALFNEGDAVVISSEGAMTAPIRTGSVPTGGITGTIFIENSAGDPNTDGSRVNDGYSEANNRGYGGAICQKTYNSGYAGGSLSKVSLVLDSNTLIENNTAHYGGGVMLYVREDVADSNVEYAIEVNGATISQNRARQNGGGAYLWNAEGNYKTTLRLNSGTISNNTAINGGGAYVINTDVTFGTEEANAIVITENYASNSGGALYLQQDTIGTSNGNNGSGDTVVSNGMIVNNTAAKYGGGIFQTGPVGQCTVTGEGSISGNIAANGGGIYVENGSMNVNGGYIVSNQAVGTPSATTAYASEANIGVGGGIYLHRGTFNMTAATKKVGLYGNTADFAADDVYAAPSGTTLQIPEVSKMDLTNFGQVVGTVTDWFEDYAAADSSYESGLCGGGYKNNSSEIMRYRQADDDHKIANKDTSATNQYICLTLGFQMDYKPVTIQKFVESNVPELITNGTFRFRVDYNNGIQGDVSVEFTLKDGESKVIDDVINGTTVTVTELNPEGYAVSITVFDANGNKLASAMDSTISAANTAVNDKGITIVFTNYTGYELPDTGGAGTYLYTMGGALLMAAAILLYIHNLKRRKEARPSF